MISNQILASIFAVLAGSLGLGLTYYYHLPSDNPVEQIAEEVIKYETGVDIDLSPKDKGDGK